MRVRLIASRRNRTIGNVVSIGILLMKGGTAMNAIPPKAPQPGADRKELRDAVQNPAAAFDDPMQVVRTIPHGPRGGSHFRAVISGAVISGASSGSAG